MLKNKLIKLVIDTNLWISFIISNKQNVLDFLLFSKKVRVLFSIELITEIETTITKPKLTKYFGSNALEEMLSAFDSFIDLIEVQSIVTVCRDSKDNFLLTLAKDGNADYLLTGDRHLLELKKFNKTKIMTITSFINETKNYR